MLHMKITIDRITDFASYPGWVECHLYDAFGVKHTFIGKIPYFTCADITPQSNFPQEGSIRCEPIKEWTDRNGMKIVTVSTEKPDDLESLDGIHKFDVFEYQTR